MARSESFDDEIDRGAAPAAVRVAVERLTDRHPGLLERLEADAGLRAAVIAVTGASRSLTVALENDPAGIEVLAALDDRPAPDTSSPQALAAWKRRELARIAARDLLGLDDVATVTAGVAALARDVLAGAHELAGEPDGGLAIIGMGKLGGDELNYASDIDVMFVGAGDIGVLERRARKLLDVARGCFRVDANLRPQGRDGPLVRSLDSYAAYWERWAEPWEFQALLKARAVAGDVDLGRRFEVARDRHLWGRVFSADDLRALRAMKARSEDEVARKGSVEVKRGRGGLRDIEFAVQLLQLVHGRTDQGLRSATTLRVLDEMARAGYVDAEDAQALAAAYCFLRAVEHRLQLLDEQQVYTLPRDAVGLERLARTMGYRDTGAASSVEHFESELTRHQATVRGIHERLYFRPLLELLARADGGAVLARAGAVEDRLAAFGFADALRTRAAVRELTRGLTRASRVMQQMLPLLFDWLSASPDPDLGLLCLRNLTTGRERADELSRVFRDVPEAARRLCLVMGTSRVVATAIQRNPDLVPRLADVERLRTQDRADLVGSARKALAWRDEAGEQQAGLRRWKERHLVGVQARDILGLSDVREVERDVTVLAEAVCEVALEAIEPEVPFAVIALGRFGGAELSYASDLDVVFAYDGDSAADQAVADRVAQAFRRFVGGAVGSDRIWEVDCDLRPEGKQGLLARTIEGYQRYFERDALTWERQAMARARPVAGDPALAARFMALVDDFVWGRGLTDDEVREIRRVKARVERERIPAGEDPQFHLKLGRGSLSDVEFTAQLLQLRHGVAAPSTMGALDLLAERGALSPQDHAVLADAYRFCERTRNRFFLVRSAPGNSLPQQAEQLRWLARSLETSPAELREQYRRVTRRARAVVERVFYGRDAAAGGSG